MASFGDLRLPLLGKGLGIKAANVAAQFAVGVLLARMLGPEALGIYAFTMALVQIIVIVAQLGFPAFLVRSVAFDMAKQAYSEIKGLASCSGWAVLVLSILILGVAYSWLATVERPVAGVSPEILLTGFLLLPPLALLATASGAIRGFGMVIASQIPDQITRPLVFLAILVAIHLAGGALSAERALLAHGAAALAALALATVILLRKWPPEVRVAQSRVRTVHWLRQSFPFLLLAGMQVVNQQVDVLMLGLLDQQDQVGLYRVTMQVVEGLGLAFFSLAIIIAPQLARLHAENAWSRIQQLLIQSHRVALMILLPVSLAAAALSGPLLALVFGESYRQAGGALEILALGKIAFATVGFAGLALSMLARTGAAVIVTLATVGVNVALNAMLIPLYGIEGAAFATATSQFLVNALAVLALAWQTGRDVSALGLARTPTGKAEG